MQDAKVKIMLPFLTVSDYLENFDAKLILFLFEIGSHLLIIHWSSNDIHTFKS